MRQNSIDIRVLLAEVVAVKMSRSQRCHKLGAYQRARTRTPIWRRSISTHSGRTTTRMWCNSSLPKSKSNRERTSARNLMPITANHPSGLALVPYDVVSGRLIGTPLERSTTAHIPTPPVPSSQTAQSTHLTAEHLILILPPGSIPHLCSPPQNPRPSSPENTIPGNRSVTPNPSLPHHHISGPERSLSPHQALDP